MRPGGVDDHHLGAGVRQNLAQPPAGSPDRPRPAEPDRPKVVNRHPGRDQLVPQPAAEAQSQLRLHPRGQVPQPGQGRQKRLYPAVEVAGGQVQNLHRVTPRPGTVAQSLVKLCSAWRFGAGLQTPPSAGP